MCNLKLYSKIYLKIFSKNIRNNCFIKFILVKDIKNCRKIFFPLTYLLKKLYL